jgi:uncharacterized membrane protein YgcG
MNNSPPSFAAAVCIATFMVPGSAGAAHTAQSSGSVLRWTPQSVLDQESTPKLTHGHLLLSSSRGLFGRSNTQAEAGPVRIDCEGTVLATRVAGQPISVTCVEGHATLRLTGRRGAFVEMSAGQMLLLNESATQVPAPAMVRLSRLRETHPLLGDAVDSLPASGAISQAVEKQEAELRRGRLIASGLQIKGGTASAATGATPSGSDSSTSGQSSSGSSSSSSSSASSGSGGSTSSGGAANGGGSSATAAVAAPAACG